MDTITEPGATEDRAASTDSARRLLSVTELARELGVSPSTVSRQVGTILKNHAPAGARPLLDLEEAKSARATQVNPLKAHRGKAVGGGDGGSVNDGGSNGHGATVLRANAAFKAMQIQKLQLELAEKRKLVVDRAGVERAMQAAARTLVESMVTRRLQLAQECAGETDTAVIMRKIEASDTDLLRRIKDALHARIGEVAAPIAEDSLDAA